MAIPVGMNLFVGSILGILTGLGIGGGSLLMLWLTLWLGVDQAAARGINLLFFLPSALVACAFRRKQGMLNVSKVLPAILTGTAAAAVFTLIGQRMDTEVLKKGFGVLLFITGIRELMYRGS